MTALDPALIEQIAVEFEKLNGVDFSQLAAELRGNTAVGVLQTVADVASLVSVFVPDAKFVQNGAEVGIVLIKLRQEGLWTPGEDPSCLNHNDQPTSAG